MTSEKETGVEARLAELLRYVDAHEDVQAFLDNSASWADSRIEANDRSRARAWRLTAVAGVFGLLGIAVGLAAIGTSYQPAPPPEILVVDRTTGQVDRMVSLQDYQMTAEEATIKRNVATFLRARENYSYQTAEDNFYDAGAFMTAKLKAQWVAYWDLSNPSSPFNNYGKDTTVRIKIGAITINHNPKGEAISARATFTRIIERNGSVQSAPTTWVASLPFDWGNPPMSERDRRVNDLGWFVTGYHTDADIGGTPNRFQQSGPQKILPTSEKGEDGESEGEESAPPALVAPTGSREAQ